MMAVQSCSVCSGATCVLPRTTVAVRCVALHCWVDNGRLGCYRCDKEHDHCGGSPRPTVWEEDSSVSYNGNSTHVAVKTHLLFLSTRS
jgi:hypothetical protein